MNASSKGYLYLAVAAILLLIALPTILNVVLILLAIPLIISGVSLIRDNASFGK